MFVKDIMKLRHHASAHWGGKKSKKEKPLFRYRVHNTDSIAQGNFLVKKRGLDTNRTPRERILQQKQVTRLSALG